MKKKPQKPGAPERLAIAPFMDISMPKEIAMDLLQYKSLALNFDATTAGRFIRSLLEKYPWAITAVKVQPEPMDMERMVRAIFRDTWVSFLPEEPKDWKGVKDAPDLSFQTVFAGYVLAALTAVNWQIFFDQIKGTKRFYSMPEAAQMMGKVRQTIVKYIQEGRIQAQKIGQEWKIPIEAMEEFLDQAWQKPTQTKGNK